jgi:hypothetical protein
VTTKRTNTDAAKGNDESLLDSVDEALVGSDEEELAADSEDKPNSTEERPILKSP